MTNKLFLLFVLLSFLLMLGEAPHCQKTSRQLLSTLPDRCGVRTEPCLGLCGVRMEPCLGLCGVRMEPCLGLCGVRMEPCLGLCGVRMEPCLGLCGVRMEPCLGLCGVRMEPCLGLCGVRMEPCLGLCGVRMEPCLGLCGVRMEPCLGLCHTSLSWGESRPVTQHPRAASLSEGRDSELAAVTALMEQSPGVLRETWLRVRMELASDVMNKTEAVVIRHVTTDGIVLESASEYLLHRTIMYTAILHTTMLHRTTPVIPSVPVGAIADSSLPTDCCGREADFSLSQVSPLPLFEFSIAAMTNKSLEKSLCHTLKDLDRTEDVRIKIKGTTMEKYFSDAPETVIRHFQSISSEPRVLRNATDSAPVTHEDNSTSIPTVYHLLSQCKTTINIHHHLSPTHEENRLKADRDATTAETATSSHFLSPHFKYVITILNFVIYIWCIQNHLCKKYGNRKSSEEGKRPVSGLRVRVSRERRHPEVKYPCSSKGPGWQRSDVLHDVIHHPLRFSHQRRSDGESRPPFTAQQGANTKCQSSTSELCSFCKSQLRSHQSSTEHTLTQPETTSPVREGRGGFYPRVIQAYPLTRFLPDPTRDPHRDLAHVGYRLATLSAVPASVPVSRVRLADAGFYSRGVNDEVTCYSCHVQHSGWTSEDNPMAVHRRLSPHCAHVQQSDIAAAGLEYASGGSSSNLDASAPVQTPRVTASAPANNHAAEDSHRSSLNTHTGHRGGGNIPVHEASAPRTQHNQNHSTSSSTLRTQAGISTTAAATSSSSRADASFSSSEPSRPGARSLPAAEPHASSSDRHPASSGNLARPSEHTSVGGHTGNQNTAPARRETELSHPQPATTTTTTTTAATTTSNTATTTTTNPNTNIPANSGGSSSVTCTTSEVRGQGGGLSTNENNASSRQRPLFPRARLELGGAVYPMYQSMDSRRRTFTSPWDESRAPPLADILLSGMFYAGYGDCVRCFYCGVGLKHWVVGDDVWAEHIRWRPECPYLTAVKGEDFVRAMQRRLANTNSQSAEEANRNSPNTPASQANPQASAPTPSNTAPTPTTTSSSAATAATTTTASSTGSTQTTSGSNSSNSSSNNSRSNSSNGRSVTDGHSGAAVNATREGASATAMVTARDEQQTLARLEAENGTLTRNSQCKACRRAPINALLFPCGHLALCLTCAGSARSCPLCSQRVEASARVFLE